MRGRAWGKEKTILSAWGEGRVSQSKYEIDTVQPLFAHGVKEGWGGRG